MGVAAAVVVFGLTLPLTEMVRLHPYQYTHFNHIAGTVRAAGETITWSAAEDAHNAYHDRNYDRNYHGAASNRASAHGGLTLHARHPSR